MDQVQLLEYIMFTPIEKLPPMPESIQNEKNITLGLTILEMLKHKKLKIENMDKNGFLNVTVMS